MTRAKHGGRLLQAARDLAARGAELPTEVAWSVQSCQAKQDAYGPARRTGLAVRQTLVLPEMAPKMLRRNASCLR
jgi:hypothetical protein